MVIWITNPRQARPQHLLHLYMHLYTSGAALFFP